MALFPLFRTIGSVKLALKSKPDEPDVAYSGSGLVDLFVNPSFILKKS